MPALQARFAAMDAAPVLTHTSGSPSGGDVFAPSGDPNNGTEPNLRSFNEVHSGGEVAAASVQLRTDPCVTSSTTCENSCTGAGNTCSASSCSMSGEPCFKCSATSDPCALQSFGDCETSATPAPLDNPSCPAGDMDHITGQARCRFQLRKDFSASGGPGPYQPTWDSQGLYYLKATIDQHDFFTRDSADPDPGNSSEHCVIDTKAENEPRNELQDPLDASGVQIQPHDQDDRYYVWFTFVPMPTKVTDPFKLPPLTIGSDIDTFVLFQFHQTSGCGGGSPPLGVSLIAGGGTIDPAGDRLPPGNTWFWNLGSQQFPGDPSGGVLPTPVGAPGGRLSLPALTAGTWHSVILHVFWSACNDGTNHTNVCQHNSQTGNLDQKGSVSLWLDPPHDASTQPAPTWGPFTRQTMWTESQCTKGGSTTDAPPLYLKTGLYGDQREDFPNSIYVAGHHIADNWPAAYALVNGFNPPQ